MRYPLAIIIINYKTAQLTIDCLGTLVGEVAALPGTIVVIVDNASGDGSIECIEQTIAERGWGDWTQIIRSPVNGGFAAGNNVALRAVDADRYLLLNSDTLVHAGAIPTLMRTMDERSDAGLVGPRIDWTDGNPQNTCYRFRTPITEMLAAARTGPLTAVFPAHIGTLPVPDGPFEPDWTTFACCLIRRDVIDQVGLLDEGYFMYFDDIDYCRRAREAGWNVLYRPEARVVHIRGQSGPVKQLAAERKRRPAYFYAARNRYFAKVYGRHGLWLTNLLWEVGRAIHWIREWFGAEPHTCQREPLDIWINGLRPMIPPHKRVES